MRPSVILLQLGQIHWIVSKYILGTHSHANQCLPVPAGGRKRLYKDQMGFNSVSQTRSAPRVLSHSVNNSKQIYLFPICILLSLKKNPKIFQKLF